MLYKAQPFTVITEICFLIVINKCIIAIVCKKKKVQNIQISLYLNDFYTFYITTTTTTATTTTVATAAAVGSDFHEKCKQNCRGSEREREAEELSPYGSAFASTALRGAAFVKGKWTQRNATQRN